MEAEFILLARQWRHESSSLMKTIAATSSQADLSSPSTSTPTTPTPPTNPQNRKWGNLQIVGQIGTSSTNLSNTPPVGSTTTMSKRNYPEESDFCYQLDDPNNVSLLPRIPPSHVQLILVRLLDVIQRQIKSGELETPDDWQAQVHNELRITQIYFLNSSNTHFFF